MTVKKYKLSTGLRNILYKIGIDYNDTKDGLNSFDKKRLKIAIRKGILRRSFYNGAPLSYFGETKYRELFNYLGCTKIRECPRCKGSGEIKF